VLELWFTADGRRWMLDPTPVKAGAPHMVEVNREGTYGFSLLARPAHQKSQPPAAGETPQMWVEADWSGPTVELIDAKPTWGQQGRQVSVVWMATDNNLARQPINLAWAPTPDGPWQSIAAGIENVGRYLWRVPGHVQGRIHVRVEASDLLGNTGAAQTQSPINLPPVQ
jgi:hypothetical protein